jgi:plasmid maintenance system antidote protein VapI
MSKLKNIHPGEVLSEEFLIPMEITAYRLAKLFMCHKRGYLK